MCLRKINILTIKNRFIFDCLLDFLKILLSFLIRLIINDWSPEPLSAAICWRSSATATTAADQPIILVGEKLQLAQPV